MAIGNTAFGCGFTMQGLPVIRLAYKAGTVFHTGKVEQPITSPTPLGKAFHVLWIFRSNLPMGFTQSVAVSKRVSSAYPAMIASSARSLECGPDAWNDII